MIPSGSERSEEPHLFPQRDASPRAYPVLPALSGGYPDLPGRLIIRYSPVRHCTREPKLPFPFDLHVSTTPPAFVLSQNQTLQLEKSLMRCLAERLLSERLAFSSDALTQACGTGAGRGIARENIPGDSTHEPSFKAAYQNIKERSPERSWALMIYGFRRNLPAHSPNSLFRCSAIRFFYPLADGVLRLFSEIT